MTRILTAMVGLTLLVTACGGDGDEAEAAPTVVIDGETASEDEGGGLADGESAAGTGSESGGDATSGNGTGDATDEELALEFADCARNNGLPDFQDPVVNADGSIELVPGGRDGAAVDPDDPNLDRVIEACGDIIQGASFLPGAQLTETELEDNLLAVAQCLRDLGHDVDDPDLGGDLTPGRLNTLFGNEFDPTDPANADDITTCRQTVFGATGTPGFGRGGN